MFAMDVANEDYYDIGEYLFNKRIINQSRRIFYYSRSKVVY